MNSYGNVSEWLKAQFEKADKKPFPILSFPAVQLLNVSVKDMISDSTLQAEGIIRIDEKFNMAAAQGFMDLSLEAEAFGAHAVYSDDEIPTITGQLISTPEEADALKVPEIGDGRTCVVLEAVKKVKEKITDKPFFAECIGPFSLAGRLMDVNEAMYNCYGEPEMVHTLLGKATEFIIKYMKALKEAGADGVIMAEPLAGILSPQLSLEFSSEYIKQIVEAVQDDEFAIIYHNCGNNVVFQAEGIFSLGCRGYHFGNAIRLLDMLEKAPDDVFVFGNIPPANVMVAGTPEDIKAAKESLKAECGGYKNFWLSSGCDLPPKTPIVNIEALFTE